MLDFVSTICLSEGVVCRGWRGTDWFVTVAPEGTAMAGADPLLFVGKNLHIIGTKVGSLLDTEKALQYAARVSHCVSVW